MSTDELRNAALTLPPNERARLAHELIRSLDNPADQDVESAWIDEVERRARELSGGAVQPVGWEEARSRILESLRARRR